MTNIYNLPKYSSVYRLTDNETGEVTIGQAKKTRQFFIQNYKDKNIDIEILKKFSDALSWETQKQLDFWENFYKNEEQSKIKQDKME